MLQLSHETSHMYIHNYTYMPCCLLFLLQVYMKIYQSEELPEPKSMLEVSHVCQCFIWGGVNPPVHFAADRAFIASVMN